MSMVTTAHVERLARVEYESQADEDAPVWEQATDYARTAWRLWAQDRLEQTFAGQCVGDHHVHPHRGCIMR